MPNFRSVAFDASSWQFSAKIRFASMSPASAAPLTSGAKKRLVLATATRGSAEAGDMLANRIFAENCQDDASKATLRKFGMKI